jgi:hypothetical protein
MNKPKTFQVFLKDPATKQPYVFKIHASDYQAAEDWVQKVFGLEVQKVERSYKVGMIGNVQIIDCDTFKKCEFRNGKRVLVEKPEGASRISSHEAHKELVRICKKIIQQLERSIENKKHWEVEKRRGVMKTEICERRILEEEEIIKRSTTWMQNLLNEINKIKVENEDYKYYLNADVTLIDISPKSTKVVL